MIAEVRKTKSGQGLSVTVPCAVLARQNGGGQVNPVGVQMVSSLHSLPDMPPLPKGKQYGLHMYPSQLRDSALPMQLRELQSFWCSDTNRLRGNGTRKLNGRSFSKLQQKIYAYLGYIHGLGVVKPNLEHFARADLLGKYLGAVKASRHTGNSALAITNAIHKVLLWWAAKRGVQAQRAELLALDGDVRVLGGQMVHLLPVRVRERDLDKLQEQGRWQGTEQVLVCLEECRLFMLQHQTCARAPEQLLRVLHDIAMVSCMFGFMPSLRHSCLRSMQPPSPEPVCSDAACDLGQDCKGNRLHVSADGSMRMCFPHHKTRTSTGSGIEVAVPAQLAELLHVYVGQVRPALLHGWRGGCATLFMTPRCRPYRSTDFSGYFRSMCKRLGIPLDLPPHMLRNIFVHHRRTNPGLPGPLEAAAAQVMGNSVRAWDRAYDNGFNARQANRAVADTLSWREAVLGQASAEPASCRAALARVALACQSQDLDDAAAGGGASAALPSVESGSPVPSLGRGDDDSYVPSDQGGDSSESMSLCCSSSLGSEIEVDLDDEAEFFG